MQALPFIQILDLDLKTTLKLLATLDQERQALTTRDSNTLQQTLNQKSQLLSQLHQHYQMREKLLMQNGMEYNEECLEQWISNLSSEQALEINTKWGLFKQRLDELKVNNSINAKIVQRTQQSLSRVLAILKGQPQVQSVYGQDGAKQNSREARAITCA